MPEMLWGGRFARPPHPDMMRLTRSIDIDLQLLQEDLEATKAHARALAKAGLLGSGDVSSIDEVCRAILEEWRAGALAVDEADEDVHSLVERVLTERLGDQGARIHAGRSRNDLVVTDLRLWCRRSAASLLGATAELIDALADVAADHVETVMPGYTHLQRAQPVSLGFHLVAHACALSRDGRRFAAALEAADVSVLGAGALAGTTLPLDPQVAAGELGFAKLFANAMDAVSDRDFALDLVYAAAVCGLHLSRLAEEVVVWTSAEFGFGRLPDEWSTGSSMMPQKRNPDLAELVRGRAAGGVGDLAGLLSLLKALPLAYDRDLQEDKAFVFRAAERVAGSLEAMTRLVRALEWDRERMSEAARQGSSWATDLAEALVVRGVPFREAHGAVGRLVAELEMRGRRLEDVSEELLQGYHPSFRSEDRELGAPERGVQARSSYGATSPERVRAQIEALRSEAARLTAAAGETAARADA